MKIIYITDNFDQGQRRIARISEDTILLSSEISDVAEELSDTESEKSSNSNDLEFETFSSKKIEKRKIIESDEGDYLFINKKKKIIIIIIYKFIVYIFIL